MNIWSRRSTQITHTWQSTNDVTTFFFSSFISSFYPIKTIIQASHAIIHLATIHTIQYIILKPWYSNIFYYIIHPHDWYDISLNTLISTISQMCILWLFITYMTCSVSSRCNTFPFIHCSSSFIHLHNTEFILLWIYVIYRCYLFALPTIYYYVYVHAYVEYYVDMYIYISHPGVPMLET